MKRNEIESKVDNIFAISQPEKSRKGKVSRRMMATIAIIVSCFVITASAGLLTYYGKVETTATVSQSVLLDGLDYTVAATDAIAVIAGNTEYTKHTIRNDASVEAPIEFVMTGTGNEVNMYFYLLELQTKNSATAIWSGTGHTSGLPAYLETTGTVGSGDEAKIHIDLPTGTTLSDIEEISWWEYLNVGYPPHVDILITDGTNTDALVIEYAYNGHIGEAPMPYGALTGAWYQTFSDDGNGPSVVDDSAYCWLSSGPPGGTTIIGGTLADWKTGIVTGMPIGIVNKDTLVTAIEIEIDNWVVQSEAYVDDIQIKGTLDPITTFVLLPLTEYGLNIVYTFDVSAMPGTYFYDIEVQPN